MSSHNGFPVLTAEEAAALIHHGSTVAFSGFTPAGAAKAVPRALAKRAHDYHEMGEPYALRVITGASTGAIDDELARERAISWRTPYHSSKALRACLNAGEVEFVDMHLSHVPQAMAFGFLGKIDFAVIECTAVERDGRVYLSSSIGISPTALQCAEHVILEINTWHNARVSEMADIAILPPPPNRTPIAIHHALDRMGVPYASLDPRKIVGIVRTHEPDNVAPFSATDERSRRIARHVVKFLLDELAAGRIPKEFLPLQAGVGNVANAVMAEIGNTREIPPFTMYTEVFQDALVPLLESGKIIGASSCALTLSNEVMTKLYDNIDFFASRLVLRPQEFSNNPGVIRRLGVITLNTALEVDIYGNANSTHVCGLDLMNGIGGSGDFTRNAYLSMFMVPSIAKQGKISAVVPMVSHQDHNEHSVQVIVSENGLADLRGIAPAERARRIIDTVAHPAYRDYLHGYLASARSGHIRHDLNRCFELHRNYLETGAMLPGIRVDE